VAFARTQHVDEAQLELAMIGPDITRLQLRQRVGGGITRNIPGVADTKADLRVLRSFARRVAIQAERLDADPRIVAGERLGRTHHK